MLLGYIARRIDALLSGGVGLLLAYGDYYLPSRRLEGGEMGDSLRNEPRVFCGRLNWVPSLLPSAPKDVFGLPFPFLFLILFLFLFVFLLSL
jgi:hypothetical protein